MARYCFSLLFFVNTVFICFGQETYPYHRVHYGHFEEYANEPNEVVNVFIKDEDYIVIRKQRSKVPGGWMYLCEKFDSDFKHVSTVEITKPFVNQGIVLDQVCLVGKSLIVFGKKYVKKEKKRFLYIQKVDLTNGNITDPRQIFEYPTKAKYSMPSLPYIFTVSPDTELLAVCCHNPYSETENLLTEDFFVFDENLDEIFKYDDYRVIGATEEMVVDNDGRIASLGLRWSSGANRKIVRNLEIVYSENPFNLDLEIEEREITDAKLSLINNSDICVTGLTQQGKKLGYFLFRGNIAEENLSKKIVADFNEDDLKSIKDSETEYNSIYFREIIEHSDGTISLVSELANTENNVISAGPGGVGFASVAVKQGDYLIIHFMKNEKVEFSKHQNTPKFDKDTYLFDLENSVGVVFTASSKRIGGDSDKLVIGINQIEDFETERSYLLYDYNGDNKESVHYIPESTFRQKIFSDDNEIFIKVRYKDGSQGIIKYDLRTE